MNGFINWLASLLPEGWIALNPDGDWIMTDAVAVVTLLVTAIGVWFTVLAYFKQSANSANKTKEPDADTANKTPNKTVAQSVTQSAAGNNSTVLQVGGDFYGNINLAGSSKPSRPAQNSTEATPENTTTNGSDSVYERASDKSR